MTYPILDITVILAVWYLKAINDAILFGKKEGEWAYEVWHILDWIRSWTLPGYFLYRLHAPWWTIGLTIVLSFGFNHAYKFWRKIDVSEIDNKWRIPWLGRILDQKGNI